MKAKEGIEIGKWIAEGLSQGLESFKAGSKQVKGVPLNLQMFTEPEVESTHYVVDGEKVYPAPPINLSEVMKVDPLPFDDTLEAFSHAYTVGGIQKVYNEDQMNLEDYKELVEYQKKEIKKLEKEIVNSGKDLGKLLHEKEQLERERELWKKITFLLCDDTLNIQKMDR